MVIYRLVSQFHCLMRKNIKQINTLEIRIHALIISFNHRKTCSGFRTLMEIHKIDVRWLLTQTRSFVILFINNLSIQQHPWQLRNTQDCLMEKTCNFKNSNLLSYRKTLLQNIFEAVMNTISGILPFFPFSSDPPSPTLLIEIWNKGLVHTVPQRRTSFFLFPN